MLTQHVLDTQHGIRISIRDTDAIRLQRERMIRATLYGEATAWEVQRALEAWTAYQLGLCAIGEVRRHRESALWEAKLVWRETGSARKARGI